MTRKKLAKIQRELDALRASKHNLSSDDLIRLAKKLGRGKSKKGKHPTYESAFFQDLRPVSIPGGHTTINGHTANSILDDLELDIQRFSMKLEEEENKYELQQRRALPPATIRKGSNSG